MFDFSKSDNVISFEKYIINISGREIAPMCLSIYNCWKLFNNKYIDLPRWKKSKNSQAEWITYLTTFDMDCLAKEKNSEIPFGSTNGVYIALFFFKAIALNEGIVNINAMSDYMERFKRIGYQISPDSNVAHRPHRISKTSPGYDVHA